MCQHLRSMQRCFEECCPHWATWGPEGHPHGLPPATSSGLAFAQLLSMCRQSSVLLTVLPAERSTLRSSRTTVRNHTDFVLSYSRIRVAHFLDWPVTMLVGQCLWLDRMINVQPHASATAWHLEEATTHSTRPKNSRILHVQSHSIVQRVPRLVVWATTRTRSHTMCQTLF